MKKESSLWLGQAERDFDNAEYNLKGKRYDVVLFYTHQTAEKALKALMIEKKGHYEKIHDIVKLGKEVGVPDFLLDKAKELTQAYSYVRYPDVVKVSNLNKLAHDFIDYTRKLLKWVKQQI